MQYTIFVILAPITATITIATLIYIWRYRMISGAQTLIWCMVTTSGFLAGNTIELISVTESMTLFWAKFNYLFIAFGPVTWLAFSLDYTGRQIWLSARRFVWFCVIPMVTVFLAWTNHRYGLIWQSYTFHPEGGMLAMQVQTYGSWFWLGGAYSYLLFITGSYLITSEYFRQIRLYRQQSFWMIVGAVTPLVINMIYVFRLIPGWTKDYTPVGFALSGLAFAFGMFRFRLFDLVPIARATLMDCIEDGIIVIDRNQRVIDLNPAAESIIGYKENDAIGKPIFEMGFIERGSLNDLNGYDRQQEITICSAEKQHYFDLKMTSIQNHKGLVLGHLIALHDITERIQLLKDVETLATTDPLTDLYNRRQFIKLAQEELEYSNRFGRPISLILLDLDNFKEVNDTYGHMVGDILLKEFSIAMQETVRREDVVARFGGDEFIILLPDSDGEEACRIADRLLRKFTLEPVIIKDGSFFISFCMGISTLCGADGTELDQLLERADRALYSSKARGRAQIMHEPA